MQGLDWDQVSRGEVVEPKKKIKKEQKEIRKIKYTWYRGGFFEINSIGCNLINIEIENDIKKTTYTIDRHGYMDQIILESKIAKPNLFWKNINKIIFSEIEINIPKNTFVEDRFCIRANEEKVLAGPDVSRKRDKNLTKFLKYIDVVNTFEKLDEILIKYEQLD